MIACSVTAGRSFFVGLLLFAATSLLPDPAQAIPVFARKYQTSCQTCHSAFPKLTPFGEAFRRNGYRFPGGEDEDATQDEPVALGHEAHKKVFPEAVWPVTIPGQPPVSAQLASSIAFADEDPRVSFANLGAAVGINFAATLGDTLSAWAGAAVRGSANGAAEAELERVFVIYTPLEEPFAVLRVGRIEPTLMGMTVHRTLGFAPWILTTRVGDNGFSVDPAQVGIEVNGIVGGGTVRYAAGLVEGAGNEVNTPKDGYARLAFKIGGMRLDGIGGATEPEPWRETSLQFGAFGYYGQATVGDPLVATQTDRFSTVGGDINATWRDLNVIAAFAFTENRRPELTNPRRASDGWHAYVQADYVYYPWLIPTARYERRSIVGAEADRVSGGLYVLLRANVRAQVLFSIEGDDESDYELGQALAGMNMAF